MTIIVNISCSICGLKDPFGGCDAAGCTWRAEAFTEAVRRGAEISVICDESNNSDEDVKAGKLTVNLVAKRG